MRRKDFAGLIAILAAVACVPAYSLYLNYVGANECVQIGEPLYAGTTLIPIATFREAWSRPPFNYHVAVDETTHTVTISSSHGIGSVNLDQVNAPLVPCT